MDGDGGVGVGMVVREGGSTGRAARRAVVVEGGSTGTASRHAVDGDDGVGAVVGEGCSSTAARG